MEKEFEKELIELLKKYNCSVIAVSKEIRVIFRDENGNVKSKLKSFKLN